jgi:Leucine-rich repeat (LRR) protein
MASHNKLKELPSEIGFMRSVHLLDLSHNDLENTPDSMQDLQHLEQLYLHHNKLKQLPNLKNCYHLKELLVGYNRIDEITEENIENTANQLKILDMRDNKLKILPDEIINLQSLERLDVTNNDLSSLPFALGTLPHIKSLLVDGNPMKSIRRDIIQRGTIELLKYLRMRIDDEELKRLREKGTISPVGSPISGSPPVPDKYAMKSAQMMNISKKELASLPDEAVANALEADVNGVDLSQNHLSEFPQNLEPLIGKLFELNLSHNKISKDLPGTILGNGKNLQYLNLSNNRLDNLPSEISDMTNLREICLSFNKFKSIPTCLQNCEKLETLLLNGNQIQIIDVEGLSRLKRLAILDLSNNDINHVPPELGKLTQLKTLQLEGNSFRVPRPQILVQGTQSVMNYLRDRIPS